MAVAESANRMLRAKLAEMMQSVVGKCSTRVRNFGTDNGAMIAYAGMVRLNAGAKADLSVSVRVRAVRAELSEIVFAHWR